MIEPEKKGSTWPWIAVPVAAVIVFFALRECQHRLPPADHSQAEPATSDQGPATPVPDPNPGEPETAPAPAPAPQ
jgi:hypothetical protein